MVRVTANFGGVDVVLLKGAIVARYGWGCQCDDQLWGSGRSIAGPWHPTQQWHPEKASRKNCLELLANITLFSIH